MMNRGPGLIGVTRLSANGVRQHASLAARTFVLTLMVLAAGCASIPPRNPVPANLVLEAHIPDVPQARFWGDEAPPWLDAVLTDSQAELEREFSGVYGKPQAYVAISGGGANGAFGAGLFVGWTAAGTRPEFLMVTGISTGALSAPFVFLGPDYDAQLKAVYTTTKTADVAKKRGIITGLFSDSLADTTPLKHLIARYITADLLDAIAREHERGRRLFIGTMNVDAGRSVIWNIGAIAASTYPAKLELVREVLRASAAIPVAFPPVSIPVEANGTEYEELHVDGGTGNQVFVYPAAVNFRKVIERLAAKGTPEAYVVRNAFIDPDYQGIKRRVLPIASRSIDSLIRTQGIGDLYQIYALCQRDGIDFNLAYIPSSFTDQPSEGFDPVYMQRLFDLGYDMARNGYPWHKGPPGFDQPN